MKEKGFSLIELLAALTMGLAIIGMLVFFYVNEKKNQFMIEGRSEALQSAEAISRIASKELRAIPGNTPLFQDTAVFKIFKFYTSVSGNDTFCYYADVFPPATFGNGSLDTLYETFGLVYDAAANTIYNVRYSGGTYIYNVLIPGVDSFSLIAYDTAGVVVNDTLHLSEIAYIDISVTTFNERNMGQLGSADTNTFSRRVTIRSRM